MQTKTFVIDFASADNAAWEALLGELKPIEVGVLGAFVRLGNPFRGTDSKCTSGAVNCVGVSHEFPTDFVDTEEEELSTIVDVNVSATLRITSLIAPAMVSRSVSHIYLHRTLTLLLRAMSYSKKGLILNMGSFAGASPTPMLAVYSGSKAFLRTWSDALTAELTPKGITVEHVNTYFVVRLLYFVRFSG